MTRSRLWVIAVWVLSSSAVVGAEPLPRFSRLRLGSSSFQHGSPLAGVHYLPGGKEIASFSNYDQRVRVWELASGRETRSFAMPDRWDFGADGRTLILLPLGEPCRLVDLASEREPIELPDVPRQGLACYALSPDGKTLAAASQDREMRKAGLIQLWDVATGKAKASIAPSPEPEKLRHPDTFQPDYMLFSPDNKTLASFGGKGLHRSLLRLWDTTTGKELPVPSRQDNSTYPFFSSDGKMLIAHNATSSDDPGTICVWDVSTGKQLRTLGKLERAPSPVLLSDDSKTLVVANRDEGTARVWDLATGKEYPKLPESAGVPMCVGFALAPDGKTLALAYDCGSSEITLWDIAAGKVRHKLQTEVGDFIPLVLQPTPNYLNGVLAFSRDGKELAAGTSGAVRRWNPITGKEITADGESPRSPIHRLTLAPDRKALVGIYRTAARQVDAASGKVIRTYLPPADAEHASYDAAYAPDGRTIAIGWPEGLVQLCDPATGKQKHLLAGHPGVVYGLAFAPDSRLLASVDEASTVLLWDAATGRLKRRVTPAPSDDEKVPQIQGPGIPRLTFSEDGKMLAALTADGTEEHPYQLRVWEVATGELRWQNKVSGTPEDRKRAETGEIPATAVHLAPDGRTLVWLVGRDVRLWDMGEDVELRGLDCGSEPVADVAFSPDGRFVAGAGIQGTVRIWDVSTGAIRARLTGHRGRINTVLFADARTLVTGGSDGTILSWDITSAIEEGPAPGQITAWWDALAEKDATQAYRAICALSTTPRPAVTLLGERIRPVEPVDPQRLEKLMADLESNKFAARQKATAELEKLGDSVAVPIQKRLDSAPPLEVRQRLEKLLERLDAPMTDPDQLRALRAVEVLEKVATPEAKALLKKLAGGAADARLTREAAAALERLAKRASGG